MKKILAINGSASENASNLRLLQKVAVLSKGIFEMTFYDGLSELPHFNPALSNDNTPPKVVDFRKAVLAADGIIICTPEYIFSIPSRLKNAIEWCVSTTVFSKKPVGLITASASGKKGHEELKLIMSTIEAVFTEETTLLIPGIKGKIDREGNILNKETELELVRFVKSFNSAVEMVEN